MKKPFNVLAIIGKPRDQQAIQTHKEIYHWLRSLGYTVFIDDRLREILTDLPTEHFASLIELGKKSRFGDCGRWRWQHAWCCARVVPL